MKKVLVVLVICIFVIGLLAGCGGSQATTNKTTQMILATGGTSGTYYPLGGAMAQIFNTRVPNVKVTAQPTGASVENLRLVNQNYAEMAIVQTDMADYAYNGKENFNVKLDNISGIAILYPEFIQVVVSGDSGITSVADFKGKKIGIGAPGSGTEANTRQILDVYGIDYKMIIPNYLSFSDCADQIKDKKIDGFIFTAGIPNSAIQEIATQHTIKILSLPKDIIAKLVQKYPFMIAVTIPANTYKGQNQPVKTVAVQATLIVNPEVKKEVVYNITKSLFENQADLANAHAKGKELSLERAVKGMSIPLHPGAEKYYKEKGIIKETEVTRQGF